MSCETSGWSRIVQSPSGVSSPVMPEAKQNSLLGLDLQELVAIVQEAGEPQYRAQQIFDAVYGQRVKSAEQISTLPAEFRSVLTQQGFSVGLPVIERKFVSRDGTIRYLIAFTDGQSVETVWMPEGDAGETGDGSEAGDELEKASQKWERATICVSSQVGCAVDCQFCMTAPTAGIVPRIYDFAEEAVRPKLAISLNASNNELRTRLMPLNKKWDLEKLMTAARDFPLRNRERLTFEYVLLDEVNDSVQNAREVAELIRGIRAKVNLIALNPGPEIGFRTPSEERVRAFQRVLVAANIPTFIRRPRGRDIYAACG